jgi:hypothetical protein
MWPFKKEPESGEWWMCEVYHHQVPYMQVLYRDGDQWLPKMNGSFKQSGMIKTIKPKYKVVKEV